MLYDHQINPETIIEPRSFTGLMALYESNFYRVKQLVPSLHQLTGYHISHLSNDFDLHLRIHNKSKHTITFSLSHFFFDDEWVTNPDFKIRVYLDSNLSEALSALGASKSFALKLFLKKHDEELSIRWNRNVMLNKWLEYLLDKGHMIVNS